MVAAIPKRSPGKAGNESREAEAPASKRQRRRWVSSLYELACKQKGAVSMCELLDLYWDRGKNAGNVESRVSMLVSYLQNSNDNPEALANTFKLLGATPAEISEAKRIYNESKKETITPV